MSVELIYKVINYCDIRDLRVAITTTNHFYTSVVHKYVRQCFGIMAGRIFKDKGAFVSGPAALHVCTLTDKNACEYVSNRSLTYTELLMKCSIH